MLEWNEAVQKMIRWVEANLDREPALLEMSRQVGYSPWYCSTLFHRICGDTVKSYAARRRLSLAALDLRDSEDRILDIAVKHGFSSQEALTRAFRGAFGCTPAAYRRNPRPIPLFMGKEVFHPWQYSQLYKGGSGMSVHDLREARVRVEYIPAHKYIGIWEDRAQGYGDFWQYHDCDHVCGIIESMRRESHPVVASHTAGWHYVDSQRRYFYGFGVSQDYSGPVPEGFELRSFPGSYYLVFYHPPFDYMEDNGEVMRRVEELAWNYDLENERLDPSGISTAERGGGRFAWNEAECQCYQRHYPEGIGYEVLRPVKLK
ncbi:AraC family transcriptional regulator [Acutalibacter sp. 1XD8-33]|uniref:helix-turn-helix transcriptional regulator n=1 Tax=Acutalibacter sp. 1XD8-33 TaxID=2320081 RepID=UPI000EA3796E|nr:AraC family transcriptional regulator [Acutalibacter sp. 1XD8-33]RKJ41691.1 AraC family transcriptional regulator [Acutalibacter sp. 1XD8-33]